MIIRTFTRDELIKADEFQQKILNPENKRRYRTFGYIKKQFERSPELFVGAFEESQIIGIAFGYIKKKNVLLGEFAINPEFRNKGIGTKLLEFFEKRAKEAGKEKVITGALEKAEGFYFKNGYKPILFLQIKYWQVPKNYTSISKFKIKKETNYIDAKRLFLEVTEPSKILKMKMIKLFNAYSGIYLFEKDF